MYAHLLAECSNSKYIFWFETHGSQGLINNNIIPRARMGFESIAHEAEGQMGYWLRGHEGERNNTIIAIMIVKSN